MFGMMDIQDLIYRLNVLKLMPITLAQPRPVFIEMSVPSGYK
jgi:hypothetical protein